MNKGFKCRVSENITRARPDATTLLVNLVLENKEQVETVVRLTRREAIMFAQDIIDAAMSQIDGV